MESTALKLPERPEKRTEANITIRERGIEISAYTPNY